MKMDWLTQNKGVKVVALILAIGLWYYAIGEEGIEITRTVPLEIEVKNDHISMLKVSANHVKVTLIAPRGQVANLASEGIKVVHEIGPGVGSAGDYSFRLQPGEIKLPSPYIRVLKIEPEVIQVTLDELIVKKLEVKPDFTGEPAFGYKLQEAEVQLNPNAIMIEGPKAQLEALDFVKTEPVDLVGRIRSFRRMVKAALPSNVKALSAALIDVGIPIQEEFDEKSFEGIAIKVLRDPERNTEVTLEPSVLSFVLKGASRRLEKLDPEKLIAYLDISVLGFGEHEVPADLVLPEGVNLKDETAILVKVVIKEKK